MAVSIVTPLLKHHVPQLQVLCEEVGWDGTVEQFEQLWCTFGSSMKAIISVDGQLLGHVGIFDVGNHIAVVDLVVVHKDHRGTGVGRQLMEHLVENYRSYRLSLVAAEGQTDFYKKFNFQETGYHMEVLEKVPLKEHNVFLNAELSVELVDAESFSKLVQFASEVHNYDIEKLLHCILANSSSECLSVQSHGNMLGFIMYKRVKDACQICCFYAVSPDSASCLLAECVTRTSGAQTYRIAIPSPNKLNIDQVLDQHFEKKDGRHLGTEAIMSTTGSVGDNIAWVKIYSGVLYSVLMPL